MKVSLHHFAILAVFGLALGLGACGIPPKTSQASAPSASSPEQIEAQLVKLLLDDNQPQAVIDNFEQSKALLQDRMAARIYYATALCQMAGAAKETADQLRWVRKGLGEFDKLSTDYPEEVRVYLYRAITYSHFPTVLGVNDLVVADIDKVNQGLKTKGWKLGKGELRQLSLSWINLGKIYKKADYLAQAKTQIVQDGLSADQGIQDQLAQAAKAIQ